MSPTCAVRTAFALAGGIVGLNIGKNAATPIERAVDDYLAGLEGVFAHADYVDGEHLQPEHPEPARSCRTTPRSTPCSARCSSAALQLQASQGREVPMFVKIAPDLDELQVQAIAAALQQTCASTA